MTFNRTHLLALSAVLALSACQATTGQGARSGNLDTSLAGAMASAATDAADSGYLRESLMFNERLYRGAPTNAQYILNYARDLRRAGKIEDALLVVRTPALEKNASEPLLTECAKVLIARGDYAEAGEFAARAVKKNGKSPDAHQALALAQSGLGEHAAAQSGFEKALAIWPAGRDRTPVINNLAMSLTAQGKVSEARGIMARATGEALQSEVYQNNRALLGTLEDRAVTSGAPSPDIEIEVADEHVVIKPARKPDMAVSETVAEDVKVETAKPVEEKPAEVQPAAAKTAEKPVEAKPEAKRKTRWSPARKRKTTAAHGKVTEPSAPATAGDTGIQPTQLFDEKSEETVKQEPGPDEAPRPPAVPVTPVKMDPIL